MVQEVQGMTKDGVQGLQGVQGTTRAQELSSVPEISEVPGVSVESRNQEVQGDKGTELPETTNKMKPKKQLSSETPTPLSPQRLEPFIKNPLQRPLPLPFRLPFRR